MRRTIIIAICRSMTAEMSSCRVAPWHHRWAWLSQGRYINCNILIAIGRSKLSNHVIDSDSAEWRFLVLVQKSISTLGNLGFQVLASTSYKLVYRLNESSVPQAWSFRSCVLARLQNLFQKFSFWTSVLSINCYWLHLKNYLVRIRSISALQKNINIISMLTISDNW